MQEGEEQSSVARFGRRFERVQIVADHLQYLYFIVDSSYSWNTRCAPHREFCFKDHLQTFYLFSFQRHAILQYIRTFAKRKSMEN